MIITWHRVLVLAAVLGGVAISAGAAEYADAEAAFDDGIQKAARRNVAEARVALEAALDLAPDDEFRTKTYEALLPIYSTLPEQEPMIVAAEFVMRHSRQPGRRAHHARLFTGYLVRRGLIDGEVTKHEKNLAADGDDLVALAMLCTIYGGPVRNDARRSELIGRLQKLERAEAADYARAMEAMVGTQPERAASHWKDAAVAWVAADDKDSALAAAGKAEQAEPKPPGGILLHLYHVDLGNVYAECGDLPKAIAHLEKAIQQTEIPAVKDQCQARISQLRAAEKK